MNIQQTNGRSVTEELPMQPDVIRALLIRRNRVDAESREGRILSNIIKIMRWPEDPDSDRSWAKHPTQSRSWMMNWQLKALAKLKH